MVTRPYLSSAFVTEDFEFYRKYLRGAKEIQPRWKRCVQIVDEQLGEALGQAFVRKMFAPETKAATLRWCKDRSCDGTPPARRDWMSEQTKQQRS